MNVFQRLAMPAVFLLALPIVAQAVVPEVQSRGSAAKIRCNTTAGGGSVLAVHADKIIFRLTDRLMAAIAADQPEIDKIPLNSELDIKVIDDPETIADLRGKVLTFIGAVDNAVNRSYVNIIDVDYAMVCPVKPFALPAGG
jgi:hypothetical protein